MDTPDYLEVSPADRYNRYRSDDEVQAGWEAGHDFFIHSPFVRGNYLNNRDHANYMPDTQVVVRYGGQTPAAATDFYPINHKKKDKE